MNNQSAGQKRAHHFLTNEDEKLVGLGFISLVFVFSLLWKRKTKTFHHSKLQLCTAHKMHTEKDLSTAEFLHLKFSPCEIVSLEKRHLFVKLLVT